jgi:hypothetical protein
MLFCVSQTPNTFEKIANCVNYKIQLKQSKFGRTIKELVRKHNHGHHCILVSGDKKLLQIPPHLYTVFCLILKKV